jgi:hypothetical protein
LRECLVALDRGDDDSLRLLARAIAAHIAADPNRRVTLVLPLRAADDATVEAAG